MTQLSSSSMHRGSIVDKMMDYWIKPGQRQKNPHHWAGRAALPCPRTPARLRAHIQVCWVWPAFPPKELRISTVEHFHFARGALRAGTDGGRQLARLNAELKGEFRLQRACEICSSLQTFFADCVTLSFLRRKQGNSALFAWVSHPSPWLRTHCAIRWTAPFWFTALIMFYSRNMVLMSKLMGKILLRSNNVL